VIKEFVIREEVQTGQNPGQDPDRANENVIEPLGGDSVV
jgi:hypothetical protein